MVELPWSRGDPADESGDTGGDRGGDDAAGAAGDDDHAEALVVCRFQDGRLAVYADRVVIERARRSRFDDKTIPIDEIEDVTLTNGLVVGYLQIEQVGVEPDSGGLLSSPIDENTLHFGHGGRDCASTARTEILAHTGG